jgi:hypothetical protein
VVPTPRPRASLSRGDSHEEEMAVTERAHHPAFIQYHAFGIPWPAGADTAENRFTVVRKWPRSSCNAMAPL